MSSHFQAAGGGGINKLESDVRGQPFIFGTQTMWFRVLFFLVLISGKNENQTESFCEND